MRLEKRADYRERSLQAQRVVKRFYRRARGHVYRVGGAPERIRTSDLRIRSPSFLMYVNDLRTCV